MIRVGITGGIGSGKSTVCKVFSQLGVPVFEADKVAKELMNYNPEVSAQLIRTFGESVYLPDHTINRKHLAALVFSDQSLLSQLNDIVHPAVRKAFYEWTENQTATYIIHEAAILFESGFYKLMDKTVTVVTNENQRIERVKKRDGASTEQVKERIKNQWSDEQRIKLADFVIYNNDNELIIPQIVDIDKKIRAHG